MRRTRDQVLRSLDRLAADLILSGMRSKAKRLRRYRTEITSLFGISEKRTPRKDKWTRANRRRIEALGLDARDLITGIFNDSFGSGE